MGMDVLRIVIAISKFNIHCLSVDVTVGRGGLVPPGLVC